MLTIFIHVCMHVLSILALVAEQQVTPDVPIALVQLSSLNQSSLLSVSYSQLYAFSNWSISQGQSSNIFLLCSNVLYAYTCIHLQERQVSLPLLPWSQIPTYVGFTLSSLFFFFLLFTILLSLPPPSVPPLSPSLSLQGYGPGLVILWIRVPLHLLPASPLSLAVRSSLSVASGTTVSNASRPTQV